MNKAIPNGWRSLKEGERTKKGDKFLSPIGNGWLIVSKPGYIWNHKQYWPMIRKWEEGESS